MYGLKIDRASSLSNTKQLENQLRETILNGKLTAGIKLPPTRSLAKELDIARNTVIQVYEQLIAEGYLESREGSGTYVADIGKLPVPKLSMYKEMKSIKPVNRNLISFNAGDPDVHSFPRLKWAKMLRSACLDAEETSFTYTGFNGYPDLRKAISSYVYRVKGIHCSEDQIVIVPGAAGGMDILAKALKKKTGRIAMEDPCIHFVKSIFISNGYDICPVEVDSQGMDMNSLLGIPKADLVYVVPSHQFPIGGVLPAVRRIALLSYASEHNAYVIEDDYDSEFRYKGEAIQALRNLSPEQVIYIGSFSKIFLPSLRMGYMILPEHLIDQVKELMENTNIWTSKTTQQAMAEFMKEMLLDHHIYKMKKIYEGKRKYLIKCLTQAFEGRIKISGEYAGLHLLVSFDRELNDTDQQSMEQYDVEAELVEEYAIRKGKHTNQLVLGYGGLSLTQIEEGVNRLKQALHYKNS